MLQDIFKNPVEMTDCYNLSHPDFKENLDWEVSHMYDRDDSQGYGGMYLYGFSEIVNRILSIKIEKWMIDEASENAKSMGLWFPYNMWMRVVKECNGFIPLHVESVPEGTWCPNGTPFAQISNTVEGFGDFVTWYEGVFMMAYFASACLTEAMKMREYIIYRKEQFGYDDSFMWRFHDFGFRSHRSPEDSYWASTAWNMALQGTDTFHSKKHTKKANIGSIPAQAHKVTQQFDREFDSFKRAIDKTHENGGHTVSLLIDTYDSNRFIREYLLPLAIYAFDKGLNISCRPDSGPTWEQAVAIYKIVKKNNLTNVSVLIGESMSFENAKKCDEYMLQNGVPLSFILYGIGGGFHNHIERDTHGWAMKTAFSNGKPRMKFSMVPLKRSIPGKVSVIRKGKDLFVEPRGVSVSGSIYQTIYYHSTKLIQPDIYVADWNKTREHALSQDTSQTRIYLSDEIVKLVEDFEKIYRKG